MTENTPDGLPVVSSAAYESLLDILEREVGKSPEIVKGYYKDFGVELERFKNENPSIYQVLEFIQHNHGKSDYFRGFALGMYITYELLRRQAAANKLENELKL